MDDKADYVTLRRLAKLQSKKLRQVSKPEGGRFSRFRRELA